MTNYINPLPENLKVFKLATYKVNTIKFSGTKNIVDLVVNQDENVGKDLSTLVNLPLNSLFACLLYSPVSFVNRGNWYITGFDNSQESQLVIKIFIKDRNESSYDQLSVLADISFYFLQGLNLKVLSNDEESYLNRAFLKNELIFDDEQSRLRILNEEKDTVIPNIDDLNALNLVNINLSNPQFSTYEVSPGQLVTIYDDKSDSGFEVYYALEPQTIDLSDETTLPKNNLTKYRYSIQKIGDNNIKSKWVNTSDKFTDYPIFVYNDGEHLELRRSIIPGQPVDFNNGGNMILPLQTDSIVEYGDFEPNKTSQILPADVLTYTSNVVDENKLLNRNFVSDDNRPYLARNTNTKSHIIDVENPLIYDYWIFNLSSNITYLEGIKVKFRSTSRLNPGRQWIDVSGSRIPQTPQKTFIDSTIEGCQTQFENWLAEPTTTLTPLEDPEDHDFLADVNRASVVKFEITDGVEIVETYYKLYVNYEINKYKPNRRPIRLVKLKCSASSLSPNEKGVISKLDYDELDKETLIEDITKSNNIVETSEDITITFDTPVQNDPNYIYALEFDPDPNVSKVHARNVFWNSETSEIDCNTRISNNPTLIDPSSANYDPYFIVNTDVRKYIKSNYKITKLNKDNYIIYKLDERYTKYTENLLPTTINKYGQIAVIVNPNTGFRIIYEWVNNSRIRRYRSILDYYKQVILTAEDTSTLQERLFITNYNNERCLFSPEIDIRYFVPYTIYKNVDLFNSHFLLNPDDIVNIVSIYDSDSENEGRLFRFDNIELKQTQLIISSYNLMPQRYFNSINDLNNYLDPTLSKEELEQFISFTKVNLANIISVNELGEYKLSITNLYLGTTTEANISRIITPPDDLDQYYLIEFSLDQYYIWKWNISNQRFENTFVVYDDNTNKFKFTWTYNNVIGTNTFASYTDLTDIENAYDFKYIKSENQLYESGSWVELTDTQNIIYYYLETTTLDDAKEIINSNSTYSNVLSTNYSNYIIADNSLYYLDFNNSEIYNWVSIHLDPGKEPVLYNPEFSFPTFVDAQIYIDAHQDDFEIGDYARYIDEDYLFHHLITYFNEVSARKEFKEVIINVDLMSEEQIFLSEYDKQEYFNREENLRYLDTTPGNRFFNPICKVGTTYQLYTNSAGFYFETLASLEKRIAFEYITFNEIRLDNTSSKLKSDTVYYINKLYSYDANNKKIFKGIIADINYDCKDALAFTRTDAFETIGLFKTLNDEELIQDELDRNNSSIIGLAGYPNVSKPENIFVLDKNNNLTLNTWVLQILHKYLPLKQNYKITKTVVEDGKLIDKEISNPYLSYEVIDKPYTFKHLMNFDHSNNESGFFFRYKNVDKFKISSTGLEVKTGIYSLANLNIWSEDTVTLTATNSVNFSCPVIKLDQSLDIKYKQNNVLTSILTLSNSLATVKSPINLSYEVDNNSYKTLFINNTKAIDFYKDKLVYFKDIKYASNGFKILGTDDLEKVKFEDNVITVTPLIDGTATHARYSDYAEYFKSYMKHEAGTLIDLDENGYLIKAKDYCLGVVSTNPGMLIGKEILDSEPNSCPVVSIGKAPVLLDSYSKTKNIKVKTKLYLSKLEQGKASVVKNGECIGIVIDNKPVDGKFMSLLKLNF